MQPTDHFMELERIASDFEILHNNEIYDGKISTFCNKDIPLESGLIIYFFKIVKEWKFEIKIGDKINFWLSFLYKKQPCQIIDSKTSYTLSCPETISLELIADLKLVRHHIEQVLIKEANESLKNNDYSIKNYYRILESRYRFFEKRILTYIQYLKKNSYRYRIIQDEIVFCSPIIHQIGKALNEEEMHLEKQEKIKWSRITSKYNGLTHLIVAYIDAFYSFLNHILLLLYPMVFNINNKEKKNFYNFDLPYLLEQFFDGKDPAYNRVLDIRKRYRNPSAHGYFSQEKIINIRIPNFGKIDMGVGKVIKGFSNLETRLKESQFKICHDCFNTIIHCLRSKYPLHFNIISTGMDIEVASQIYNHATSSKKENEDYVEDYISGLNQDANYEW
jgi:CRISPR/Cas system CMR-associated protein Cmr5 small subunit